MAKLVKCKSCGHEVAINAKSCPSCGVPSPGVTAGQTAAGFLILLAIVGLGLAWVTSGDDKEKTPEQVARYNRIDAEVGCRILVKNALHDKDSAEFEPARSIVEKDGLWTVDVTVRAKNAFGAYRMANFRCELKKTKDSWQPVNLTQL